MAILQDGTGTGNKARVSGNRLFNHSIVQTEAVDAAFKGNGYNINTGTIALTTSTASGVLYIKNNEANDLVINTIIVGVGSAGTTSDVSIITLIKNPTTGTLISGATDVDMNENRNFGSSKTLTADAYKGAEGNTVTDGTDTAQFFTAPGSRLAADISFILTKGDSLAITIDTNTTAGTTNVYAAAVAHIKDTDLLNIG